MTTMRIAILGPLEVHTADGLVEIPGRRLRALLIRLALDPGRVVSAERLIDDLWQDEPPAAAQNALQALVSRLRAVVGRRTVESGGGGYRLNLPPESVDVVRFERRVRAGRAAREAGDAAAAAEQLRGALELWRGSALSDVEGTPFAEAEAAGLEEQRVAAVEDLVDAVLAQSAAVEAEELLPELEHLRAAFPLREKLHARYMKVLYALGRQAEALAAYEQLRSTLADRLGVDPSPELGKLHLAMLRQAPELAKLHPAERRQAPAPTPAGPTSSSPSPTTAEPHAAAPTPPPPPSPAAPASAPTPRTAPERLGNLPAQLTSFIGRETELELVGNLLRGTRLVTLTGPGGAGKTRLAQECGARLGELAADGVWFAPLAPVADGADVAQAVLTALGGENTMLLAELAMERVEAVTPRERLHALLAGRQLILILDNCEHVLDAVAELVDQTLSAAPHVRVLATSREPLALTGETLCPVASLALPPDPEEPPANSAVPLAAAAEDDGYQIYPDGNGYSGYQPTDGSTTYTSSDGSPSTFADGRSTDPSTGGHSATSAGGHAAYRSADGRPTRSEAGLPVYPSPEGYGYPTSAAASDASSIPSVVPSITNLAPAPSSAGVAAAAGAAAVSAAESALEYPAVQLFVERARAVRPGFQLTAASVTPVIRICRALDGIPLAIELAAARLRSLSAQQVADRLDDRFRLLSSGSRTALPRHQTLRAIVDWSWDLLSPAERTVLARLAVFAGGATPDAALHVCSAAALAADEIIDIIASLVDKSLVVAQEDEAGEVRYRLLETVRAYAAERLEESGERTGIRVAHAEHFVALAERAEPELRAADQIRWVTRLTLERDNFNAALRHCVSTEDFRIALRLYQGLLWFWMMCGGEKESTQWAEEIGEFIVRAGVEVPTELGEAYALCSGVRQVVAVMSEHADDIHAIGSALINAMPENTSAVRHPLLALGRPVAGVFMGESLDDVDAIRREFDVLADHPDPWVRAARYSFSALLELQAANPDVAERLLLTGYAKFRELGERQGLLFTLIMLVEFALAKGQFRVAVSRAQEAYGCAVDGLNPGSGSMLLIKLGQARACAGEVGYGRRLIEQGVRTAERCGELGDAAAGRAELAALAFQQDDRAEARRQLAMASSLIGSNTEKRPDMGRANSMTLARRGYLATIEGDFEIARDCFLNAVNPVRSGPFLSFMSGIDEIIRGLAALAGVQGDHVRAAELLGSAYAVVGLDNEASYSGPKTRAAAVAALGEEAFTEAFDRGRRASASEVLAIESGQASSNPT
jgi:predicted ATPase/DNA-binding SARP family transcriptional activator